MKRTDELREEIKSILTNYPKTRESDYELIMRFMFNKGYDPLKTSIAGMFWLMKHNKLPQYQTITRHRQKLMELYPELRGSNYIKRMDKQNDYLEIARYKEEQ